MTTASVQRSRHIPWIFVAGFAVVVAVNAVMVWFAVGSFSGLYAHKPRDRGLHYNQVVAEQRARDALGWRIDSRWHPETGRLEVVATAADGVPLAGARVSVELVRPAEKRPPLGIAMSAVGIGRYAGYVDLPARGNWDLDIVVEFDGKRYAVTRRMFLQ
ncbi:MAG: FixH family protein [Enhydrobacter sp.]|nr:MAG: FixH family protein [Enhydrobacter sp.]